MVTTCHHLASSVSSRSAAAMKGIRVQSGKSTVFRYLSSAGSWVQSQDGRVRSASSLPVIVARSRRRSRNPTISTFGPTKPNGTVALPILPRCELLPNRNPRTASARPFVGVGRLMGSRMSCSSLQELERTEVVNAGSSNIGKKNVNKNTLTPSKARVHHCSGTTTLNPGICVGLRSS